MKKQHNPKFGALGIIIGLLIVVLVGFVVLNKNTNFIATQNSSVNPGEFKSYTSSDLKISFMYPKDWYIDDRYRMVLLTNYQTDLNSDDSPNKNQLEVLIKEFSNCFKTLDEDMINPACGEGGSSKKNQILSKDTKKTSGGTFYKYLVLSANNKKLTFYFLQKGDKILQISKQPDPSQFENEFEKVINSITFLQ